MDEKKCSPRTRLIGTSTRAQLSRTCVTPRTTFRAHRPDRSMRKVTEREAPIGVLCPSTGETRWSRKRDSDGPGDRGRGKDAMRNARARARV